MSGLLERQGLEDPAEETELALPPREIAIRFCNNEERYSTHRNGDEL